MNAQRMYEVLLGAHISEKANNIGESSNQFTFRVSKDATKPEIKTAIETIYKVSVRDVRLLNVKGKRKRTIRGYSRKPGWKKAYVRLDEGHDIDFAAPVS